MKDNAIIKALKCLCGDEILCEDCAYKFGTFVCRKLVAIDALYLINRQQADIERLKAENMLIISERNAFRTSFYEVSKQLKHAKSEAVREFVDELKKRASTTFISNNSNSYKRITSYQFSPETIDNLVKEMVGDTNDI